MSTDRRRLVDPCGSPWSTGDGFLVRAGRRCSAAFAAALGVTVLMLSATPALAKPGIESPDIVAVPGTTACAYAEDVVAGTGATKSFTGVTFSTDEYYYAQGTGIIGGGDAVCVSAKHSASLRALQSPPSSPFTVTATLGIALKQNGRTVLTNEDTLDFVTHYITDAKAEPTPESGVKVNSPPGILVSIRVDSVFDNRGTNPRFTKAVFSNPEYLDSDPVISSERVFLRVKDSDGLNSLSSPPSSTFTHTAVLTMTNDEGAMAENTITIESTYAKDTTTPQPAPADPPPESGMSVTSPAGVLISVRVEDVFESPGTNPRFTKAVFSNPEYLDSGYPVVTSDRVLWRVKDSEEFHSMSSPPSSPFTHTALLTMTNDGRKSFEKLITLESTYAKDTTTPQPAPADPTPVSGIKVGSPAGMLVEIYVDFVFTNRGTNPRFTKAVFSNPEYLDSDYPQVTSDRVFWKVKRHEELNSMSSPPSSPFTNTAKLSMTNDEGAIAENEITIETLYAKKTTDTTPPPRIKPTPKAEITINAPANILIGTKADNVFDNPGTNAKITHATFSTLDYYDTTSTKILEGRVFVKVKTVADLNALPSPPPNPFTVTGWLTMTNDEGDMVGITVTYKTTYNRAAE